MLEADQAKSSKISAIREIGPTRGFDAGMSLVTRLCLKFDVIEVS
jgi:hypothetical protein